MEVIVKFGLNRLYWSQAVVVLNSHNGILSCNKSLTYLLVCLLTYLLSVIAVFDRPCRQSDAHQLWRQSIQCSWTSSLKQAADGPRTAVLGIQPFQTVAEDIFRPIWSLGPKRSVNPHLTAF